MTDTPLKPFYLTFPQKYHGETHPSFAQDSWLQTALPDLVCRVLAPTYNDARKKVFDAIGDKWAFLYDKQPDLSLYKHGLIEFGDLELQLISGLDESAAAEDLDEEDLQSDIDETAALWEADPPQEAPAATEFKEMLVCLGTYGYDGTESTWQYFERFDRPGASVIPTSDPVLVRFPMRSKEKQVEQKLSAIEAEMEEIKRIAGEKLRKLAEVKQSLLAITHDKG